MLIPGTVKLWESPRQSRGFTDDYYHGIDIIPGSSGIPKMADLAPGQLAHLVESLARLYNYDFFLFDTSAGISRNVVSFTMAADEVLLVVTPEPTSLTDGYSLLKVLSLNGYNKPVMVTVNQCRNIRVAGLIFKKLKETVEKYLPIHVLPFGTVVQDRHVVEAVTKQQPFISLYPYPGASKCIKNISRHLTRKKPINPRPEGLGAFWPRFRKIFTGPLQVSSLKAQKQNRIPESPASGAPKQKEPAFLSKIEPLTETGGHIFQAVQRQHIEMTGNDHTARDIQSLLCQLVENTSAISQELGEIRKAIQRW